eukprot:TRINITY_DN56715_c0_g1_i1.p1 TRINITY_DN56715_c0_g1~~TRINITY_DN56715_c0_g1_i1.p1  ORF type:complete len:340 (+),score=72.45 TRINITY_DN56715_c0_g1_i1:43-1062(+)
MASIQELKDLAAKALREEDFHGAATKYTSALSMAEAEGCAEQVPILLCNRSLMLLKIGHIRKAIEDAERSLSLSPAYPKAHYRLLQALLAVGRAEEAAERGEKSLTSLALADEPCAPDALAAIEGLVRQAQDAKSAEAGWGEGICIGEWGPAWTQTWEQGPMWRHKATPIEVERSAQEGECSLRGGHLTQHATGIWRPLPETCRRPAWLAWRMRVDTSSDMGCANTVFCQSEFNEAQGMGSTRAAVYCAVRNGDVLLSDGGGGNLVAIAKAVPTGTPVRIRLDLDWSRRRIAASVNGARVLECGFRDPSCERLHFCYLYNGSDAAATWGPLWAGPESAS